MASPPEVLSSHWIFDSTTGFATEFVFEHDMYGMRATVPQKQPAVFGVAMVGYRYILLSSRVSDVQLWSHCCISQIYYICSASLVFKYPVEYWLPLTWWVWVLAGWWCSTPDSQTGNCRLQWKEWFSFRSRNDLVPLVLRPDMLPRYIRYYSTYTG